MARADLSEMIYVSPSYETVWDRSCDSLYENPKSWMEFIHPLDVDSVRVAISQRGRDKGHALTYRIVRPDGTIRWIQDRGFPVQRGKVHGDRIAGIAEDITERKRAEEALKESEKLYRGLFESMPDGFASMDMDKRIVEGNASFRAMLGYSRKEVRALTYEDITPRKWHAIEERIIREQVMTRGYSDPYEKEYIRKDGAVFPAEIRTHLLRDEKNAPAGMCAFVRDVSERKGMQTALRESEEKYRNLAELSPSGIFVHVDGKVEFANQSFAEMLGAARPERVCGMDIFDFVHPDYHELIAARVKTIKTDRRQTPLAGQKLVKLDGSVLDAEATAFPFNYSGSDAVMVVVEDITQRKQAEEGLKRREKELEGKSFDLEQANIALKVLLRCRDEDRASLENAIQTNVKKLVLPYIEKLRSTHLNDTQGTYVAIMESSLNEIISPFLQKVAAIYSRFTPTEIQVADLIKNGKSSKEISKLLNVSTGTVVTHRNNIRNKLGLRHKNLNLQTYLLSL